jgi:hypothetical protein
MRSREGLYLLFLQTASFLTPSWKQRESKLAGCVDLASEFDEAEPNLGIGVAIEKRAQPVGRCGRPRANESLPAWPDHRLSA